MRNARSIDSRCQGLDLQNVHECFSVRKSRPRSAAWRVFLRNVRTGCLVPIALRPQRIGDGGPGLRWVANATDSKEKLEIAARDGVTG